MSIIYEALKKVENMPPAGRSQAVIKESGRSDVRPYLVYALVVALGFFAANSLWGFVNKLTQPKYAANEVLLYHELPKEAPFFKQLPSPPLPVAPLSPLPLVSHDLPLKESAAQALVLNGIFFSEDKGYALVNNQIVRENDVVGGARVISILSDRVELKRENGEIVKLNTSN